MTHRAIALLLGVAFLWLATHVTWPAWAVAVLFLAALALSARDIWHRE